MAPTSTALTTKVETGSPYQLNPEQTLKASKALLNHIASSSKTTSTGKPNLLKLEDDDEETDTSTTISLILTTKKHITDTKRLKPSRIALPHPLNTSPTTTICLITSDPQRTYKDLIASPAFPTSLSARITRVIDISKLKTKYKQYEAQRQLRDSHDIFLADDRIITRLPKVLGKTFYKATAKRPIPVNLAAPAPRSEGKRVAREKGAARVGSERDVAGEIERAVGATLVWLSPSTSTAVRVGYASMSAEQVKENVEKVVEEMVEKFVVKKWRGVKAIHVKGPETMALPIWLAEELWVEEGDVLDESLVKGVEANTGKKRKAVEEKKVGGDENVVEKKGKKQKLEESNDNKLDVEIALRKESLKRQKVQALEAIVDDIPKPSKKSKKSKVVV